MFLSRSDLFLPRSLVSGPSQSLSGLFSILFVPGNWTVNSLSSVVNNTETWRVTSVWLWLTVFLAWQTVTRTVWAVSWSQQVRADSDRQTGGPFILLSRYFSAFQYKWSVLQHCRAAAGIENNLVPKALWVGNITALLMVDKSFTGAFQISYEP